MRTRYAISTLLAASLSVCLPGALAVNTAFLHDSPIQAMTEQDLELLQQSASRALDQTADGDSLSWGNPSTGAHGTIMPTASWEEHGRACRTLQFDHQVKGRSGRPKFDFCKQPDGSWKIVPQ
jgi:surface antigen